MLSQVQHIATMAARFSAFMGWAALAIMAVISTVDVLGTAFFNKPVTGAFEMAGEALAVVVFLGLLQTQILRAHITVDLLTERLRGIPSRVLDVLATLAMTLAIGMIALQTWPQMMESWRIGELAPGAFSFPVYPIKTLVCLGATGAFLVAALQTLQALLRLFGKGARHDAD